MMLCTRGFSVCCDTASRDSSSGRPARTRVASWRVKSERSAGATRRTKLNDRWRFASFCATSLTVTGRSCRSLSSWRMWRGVSPSRTPLRSLPALSSAMYSKAPMARRQCSIFPGDPQHFLDGRLAAEDSGAPVVADGRGREAGMALELLLAHSVVDHRAHAVVHHDQLVDPRAAA